MRQNVSPRTRGPILALAAGLLVAVAATPAHASTLLEPAPHDDRADAAAGPLDLQRAALGQQGTQMVLQLRTAGAWDPAALSPLTGRTLCVKFFYGSLKTPRSRICATGTAAEPTMRYTRLDPFGHPYKVLPLPAVVQKPDARTVEAVFTPGAAGLPVTGRYWWQAEAVWDGAADRIPDNGNIPARVELVAEPRCFGASARVPGRHCRNPGLSRVVEPKPQDAVLETNQFCLPIGDPSVLNPCRFQTPPRFAVRQTVALIGDSHAAHWRAALNVVATAKRWRGISITRSGCPFSTARPVISRSEGRKCARYKRALFRWFRRHGEVKTVFVSSHIGRVITDGDQWTAQINGYRNALLRLPHSVRDVFVIRDTPIATRNTLTCLTRAVSRGRRIAGACATERAYALRVDPASVVAKRLSRRRFHVIDMSDYFCSRRVCFEVIGGALVHKDTAHLTEVFSATLGPYLLRKINRILARR